MQIGKIQIISVLSNAKYALGGECGTLMFQYLAFWMLQITGRGNVIQRDGTIPTKTGAASKSSC